MKQLIVMLAMIILGLAIAQLITGGQEGSVINTVKDVWQQEIQVRSGTP